MTTKGCGNNLSAEILGKVSSKNCTVGIVGLGYVGLPLALLFSERGFPVIGIDIDDKKIENLNDGNSYIVHISAVAVEETATTLLNAALYNAAPTSKQLEVAPPIIFGMSLDE